MATPAQWLEGARPRTLPAALAPVLAGSASALFHHGFRPGHALLALVVATALQVGVNYANDYSDGIRGTDAERVGPFRLTGSGAARPGAVKAAAFASFGVAAVAGLVLVVLTQLWWLLAVGVACLLAAWYYTGGKRPYGYAGLGEVFVFVFFGLVAVCGTTLVQVGRIPLDAVWAGVAIGALACAILVANNLRDLEGDRVAGKRTLATRLGDRGTREFFKVLVMAAAVAVAEVGLTSTWWALLGLVFVPLAVPALRAVGRGARGRDLIAVLRDVGLAELAAGAGLVVGALLGR